MQSEKFKRDPCVRRCGLLLFSLCILHFELVAAALAADKLTQADLLKRIIDLDRLTTPPPPGERLLTFSSFDRRQRDVQDGRYVHWDANDDRNQFVRRTPDGWDVLLEQVGPGAIVHLWVDKPAGQVRIVLDGQPVIATALDNLFNGQQEPFGAPLSYETAPGAGKNLYFPIGFGQSCQVLCREFSGTYQIDCVTFPPGTQVERFQTRLDPAAAAALTEVVNALTRGLSEARLFGGRRVSPQTIQQDLKPGEKLEWTIDKPGTIRALYVSLTDRNEPRQLYALHKCTLRIYWDGLERPAVECPLAEFFGTGFRRIAYRSTPLGTDLWTDLPRVNVQESWFMYCYFPMPFRSARIEIENHNVELKTPIGLMLLLRVDRAPPPDNSLRFKARYHVEDPCQVFDYTVLEASGRGRLVGCALQVDCPRKQWWGAGDHKIWIDDDQFPSILGTGTGDYFGWRAADPARDDDFKTFAFGLHGVTLTAPFGKSAMYRWHIADCVNFQKGIRFALENWQPDNAHDVYYSTVAYWYGEPGAADSFQPLTLERLAVPGLRIPGAVEIEGHLVGSDWGRVVEQRHSPEEPMSGGAVAAITATEPVQIKLPAPQAGAYLLKLRVYTARQSFETVEVSDAQGKSIGTIKFDRRPGGIYEVGRVTLAAGENTLTVRCSRKTDLDCWVLEPVK